MSEDDTQTTDDNQKESEDIKALRKKAKSHDDAVARAEAAERKLALRDAGIPNSPLGKLFEKGYDGDWSDIDSLKAAAVEYGILEPPEPPASEEEQATQQRVEQASAGGGGDESSTADEKWMEASNADDFYAAYAASGRPIKGRG